MAHLAAFEDAPFVVQVEVHRRIVQRPGHAEQPGLAPRAAPEQIHHGGRPVRDWRPETRPADRPDMLLELRGRRTLDRPVPRVVDARRQLVDHE